MMMAAVMLHKHLGGLLGGLTVWAIADKRKMGLNDAQPFTLNQSLDDLLHSRGFKLDYHFALQAGEMVVRIGRDGFEVPVIFAQTVLSNQTQAFEQRQRSIDRCQADARVPGFDLIMDGFSVQVNRAVLEHIQDQLTLMGQAQPLSVNGGLKFSRRVHGTLLKMIIIIISISLNLLPASDICHVFDVRIICIVRSRLVQLAGC
jgi:hypothetical protein